MTSCGSRKRRRCRAAPAPRGARCGPHQRLPIGVQRPGLPGRPRLPGEHVRVGALEVVRISNVLAAMTHSVVGRSRGGGRGGDEYASAGRLLCSTRRADIALPGAAAGLSTVPRPLLTAHLSPVRTARSSGTLDTPTRRVPDSTLESDGRQIDYFPVATPKRDRHLMPPFLFPSRGSTWAASRERRRPACVR